ncbi:hypothetical protein CI102_15059, partial [Trichoderma harzianum]
RIIIKRGEEKGSLSESTCHIIFGLPGEQCRPYFFPVFPSLTLFALPFYIFIVCSTINYSSILPPLQHAVSFPAASAS